MDCGVMETNKALYDFLYARRSEIEQKVSCSIDWDRNDGHRASKSDVSFLFVMCPRSRIGQLSVNSMRESARSWLKMYSMHMKMKSEVDSKKREQLHLIILSLII